MLKHPLIHQKLLIELCNMFINHDIINVDWKICVTLLKIINLFIKLQMFRNIYYPTAPNVVVLFLNIAIMFYKYRQ